MKTTLHNIVILAENYPALVEWYKKVFHLDVLLEEASSYHYTELGQDKKVIVGLTPAKEVEHTPTPKRNNSALLQVSTSDIAAVNQNVATYGGEVIFGPRKDEEYDFQYGAIRDIEGNEIWLVEA